MSAHGSIIREQPRRMVDVISISVLCAMKEDLVRIMKQNNSLMTTFVFVSDDGCNRLARHWKYPFHRVFLLRTDQYYPCHFSINHCALIVPIPFRGLDLNGTSQFGNSCRRFVCILYSNSATVYNGNQKGFWGARAFDCASPPPIRKDEERRCWGQKDSTRVMGDW